MPVTVLANATLVLPDRLVPGAGVAFENGRIVEVGTLRGGTDLGGAYLAPGFVDLHVHGGNGADFMDGTAEAFRTVCRCHAKHGTTSLTPTSTVATGPQYDRFLALCEQLYGDVQRIWQQRHVTILFVTHNVREAVSLGDRVILFSTHPGRVREEFRIELPRPRDINSVEVATHATRITRALKGHLNKGATAE